MAMGWRCTALTVALLLLAGCKTMMQPSQFQSLEAQHTQLQTQLTSISDKMAQLEGDMQSLRNSYARSAGMVPRSSPTTTVITPTIAKAQPLTASSITPGVPRAMPTVANTAQPMRFANIASIPRAPAAPIRIPGEILFASGKTSLSPASRTILDRMADVILADYPQATVRVNGYSDGDPIRKSKWSNNDDLSAERAQSVKDYLAERGIPASQIQAVGHGPTNPRATKALSRRVELSVSPR